MKHTPMAALVLATGLLLPAAMLGGACSRKAATAKDTLTPAPLPAGTAATAPAKPAEGVTGGFKTMPSGLMIKYLTRNPSGKTAAAGDKVKVHYTGTLTEGGKKFDSSRDRNQPFEFQLGAGQVIAGWDEGIALLRTGERAILRLPANLGYGAAGAGGDIPPNATLDFDVELIEVIGTAKPATPVPYVTTNVAPRTTASGVQYWVVKPSNGVQVQSGQKVTVHYTGYFEDGKTFDSSIPRGEPFEFQVGAGQVIKGWDEALPMLRVGEKARIFIPFALAYGVAGRGPIPPSSNLIFDVEVLGVSGAPAAVAPKPAAVPITPVPFETSKVTPKTTVSGLKYWVINPQMGANSSAVRAGQKVKVHYTGYFEDGKIFDSSVSRGDPFEFTVGAGQVIKGWDEALQLLRTGEKARLFIPYNIAYGEAGRSSIPPKTNLIFDVEVISATDPVAPVTPR